MNSDVGLTAYGAPTLNTDFLTESARTAGSILVKYQPRKDVHWGDRFFYWAVRALGVSVLVTLLAMGFFVLESAQPVLKSAGFQFLITKAWDPVRDIYGALPVIYGTLVSSVLSILVAAPISIGIALFINELAPRRLGRAVGFLVEMLAAIPSVVYGLWGIFVLVPFLRQNVQVPLVESVGQFLPIFGGPAYGVGMLSAGLILSIMIIPTISSIAREVFSAVPRSQREGALALGATRWEMMKLAVLKSSKAGLFGAVMLGLGRAIGETMAVTMVIGNRADIVASLFAPAQTMASVIANEYAEATSDIHLAALAGVGLVLFGITFLMNALARFLVWRVTHQKVAR